MSTPDPITISVIQHRLTGIVEEMGEAMLRTSFSQILNSSRDFSTAICAADSQLVAQADHIPVHVGALQPAAEAMNAAFADDVHPGDIFLLNDPYFGGSHLPDVTVFAPVFVDEKLAFWAINRAHHSDIGGATYGAYNAVAREIWQEGLRLPPTRLYDKGTIREDFLRLLKANVRHARDFEGDLMAQIGSVLLAERRILALTDEFGGETIRASVGSILDATEAQTRAILAEWQDGTYFGEAMLDDDGRGNENIAIRARITVAGSDLTVDLRESDPQLESFLNSAWANTRSAVLVALAVLLDPDIPKERGRCPPTRAPDRARHTGSPESGCAGDDVDVPLRQRNHRSRRCRAVGGLSGAGDGRLGTTPAHRLQGDGSAQRPPLHLALVPCAARRRRLIGRGRLAQLRRMAFGRRLEVRLDRSG